MDDSLRDEFRAGFYPNRLAEWIYDPREGGGEVAADVAGCLAAIDAGQYNFAYPGHDAAVLKLLRQIVPKRRIRRGADIGCETGVFPAMQIVAGIESCTVFEVRDTTVNHQAVEVRVQDLTYAEDIVPEFDLITCLSTIEHIGLGRYGDQIDPWGDVKMASNIRQLLRPGGILVMSFPIGRGCVVFNRHRIYTNHRRAQLFGDLRLLRRVPDLPLKRRLRHSVRTRVQGPGLYSQPIYILERAA